MNQEVISEIFHRLYSKEHREKVELLIANLKTTFENIPGVEPFITSRVKSPISIIRKMKSDQNYELEWNKMKDLIGIMIVVEENSDVDDLIVYLEENFGHMQNPNSKKLYKDYRIVDIRNDHSKETNEDLFFFDPPSDKGYQTSNGYKNVRVNLMIDEYPIEIQIKTKEQFVAHEATHDPIYKAPSIENQDERQAVSDAMFPYFEMLAHRALHKKTMSSRDQSLFLEDFSLVAERNKEFYKKYIDIHNDASQVYLAYLFIVNNFKEIFEDAAFGNTSLDLKLLEIEVRRVIHYLNNQILEKNQNLRPGEQIYVLSEQLLNMTYTEFREIRSHLAGSYRCESCAVSAPFDMLRARDIELLKRLTDSFRFVDVSIYDDQLAQTYLGKKPMYSLDERVKTIRNIRGIRSINVVNAEGKVMPTKDDGFLITEPNLNKPYKIGYVPGVFDMLHPGHIEYIKQVCDQCEEVYIGIKSDKYVKIRKNKDTVLKFDERKTILGGIIGVKDVVKADEYDITPPEDIMQLLEDATRLGSKCAIFLGSDWINKRETKSEESINEYNCLVEDHPNIVLTSIERKPGGRSSSSIRQEGLASLDDISKYELVM